MTGVSREDFRCREVEARLIDFAERRLEPAVEARLSTHLARCSSCREKSELWTTAVPAMRGLTPPAPSDLNARRLQLEVLRRLQDDPEEEVAVPLYRRLRGRALWTTSLAGVASVALLALVLHGREPSGDAAMYATLVRLEGDVTADGRPLSATARLAAGSELDVPSGAEAELLMDRGSMVRLFGPAHLRLGGSPSDVALQLDQGTLQADVLHRLPGETFAVVTRDLRVEVRGTRFVVGTGREGSARPGGWVRVQQGLVSVRFPDGRRRLVGEGELAMAQPRARATASEGGPTAGDQNNTGPPEAAPAARAAETKSVNSTASTAPAGSTPTAGPAIAARASSADGAVSAAGAVSATRSGSWAPPAASAASVDSSAPNAAAEGTSCGSLLRWCQRAARGARDGMRHGHHDRAVRLVTEAARSVRDAGAACGDETSACEDELRYLRAEALRGAGRIEDAVRAYRSLNRIGAPAAMRQNALYAAAELERRSGRLDDALVDYERALSAGSPGALREEALVGSMETADVLKDRRRAGMLAHRYLGEFPSGRSAANARRLVRLADDEQRR